MRLNPDLDSHRSIRGTLFDNVELWAGWDDAFGGYKLKRVSLFFRPKTSFGIEDKRFVPKSHGMDFGRFGSLVQRALTNADELTKFCELVPSNATVQKAFDPDLVLSNKGFFLKDWPWGAIFDDRLDTQKAATLAILEMLELEYGLPDEKL